MVSRGQVSAIISPYKFNLAFKTLFRTQTAHNFSLQIATRTQIPNSLKHWRSENEWKSNFTHLSKKDSYTCSDSINFTIKLTILSSYVAPSISKWPAPSIRCVSARPATDLSLFFSCFTLVNPSRVPITKSFGLGDRRIALWCRPKRMDAMKPNGYPKLT